jgi:hypothetical protein
MGKAIDLTGQRFGRLTVIRQAENDKFGNICWWCRCDCGKEKAISGHHLRAGQSTSCGCVRIRRRKHGDAGSKLYQVWANMKQRCLNSRNKRYKDWGGRGITVCKEWLESYDKFKAWAISSGYREGLSIDRIDNDGDYCPDNCRWATASEQRRNQRPKKRSQ